MEDEELSRWDKGEELFAMLPGRRRQVRILMELIGEVRQ